MNNKTCKTTTIKLRSISIGLVTLGVASVTWWLTYSSVAFAPNFPFYSQQSEADFALAAEPKLPLKPVRPFGDGENGESSESGENNENDVIFLPEQGYQELELNIQAGDTMVSLFEQHQLNKSDLYKILQLEQHREQLSKLRLGQQLNIVHDAGQIIDLSVQLAADKVLVVYRNDFGFNAEVLQDGEPVLASLADHVVESTISEHPAPIQTLAQIAQASDSRESFKNNRLELTVKRGDTLYKIFRQYNLSLADLDRTLKLHRQSRAYLHNLKINNKLIIERTNQNRIKSLSLVVDNNTTLHIDRHEGKFQAKLEQNGRSLALSDQPVRTRQPTSTTTQLASNNRTRSQQPTQVTSRTSVTVARVDTKIAPSEFKNSPIPSNDPRLRQMLNTAKNYLGSPYVYGGQTPRGFDCSGFVVYNTNKVGIEVPRTAHQQYNHTTPVKKSELQPGDLVFFNDSRRRGRIGHVGIYIGDNQFIHARSGGAKDVTISDLDNSYYSKHFVRGGRL